MVVYTVWERQLETAVEKQSICTSCKEKLFSYRYAGLSSASVADGCYGSSGEKEYFISIERQLNECGKEKKRELKMEKGKMGSGWVF